MLFSKKWSEIKGKRSWKREGFDNGVKTGYFQLHAWRRLAKVVFTIFFSQEINKTGMHLKFKKLFRKNTKKNNTWLSYKIHWTDFKVCVCRLRNFGRTLVHVILDNFSEITWLSKYFWTHKLYWQKNLHIYSCGQWSNYNWETLALNVYFNVYVSFNFKK